MDRKDKRWRYLGEQGKVARGSGSVARLNLARNFINRDLDMQERVRNLEILMELSANLVQEMAQAQQRMDESQRQMRGNHRRMAENQREMAENHLQIMENHRRIMENIRQIEEDLRQVDENQHLIAESQQRRDELLQQVLQALAVMQADIVRIDETHT